MPVDEGKVRNLDSGDDGEPSGRRQSNRRIRTTVRSRKKKGDETGIPGVRDVTRHVKHPVQYMLWGLAAGRCEFDGCNKPLWKSSVTQDQVNIAEKAHIYSFSDDGPRGNDGITNEQLNDLPNLMLVCPECHAEIDKKKDGGRYTAQLLKEWKAAHERRIAIVTGIDPLMKSHVVVYGANIGAYSSPLKYASVAPALFPGRYPAEDRAIELGMTDSVLRDSGSAFWTMEAENLSTKFRHRIKERLANGDVSHLSVFGLAPQPLLMLLGTLLVDLPPVDAYQLHREPERTWKWPDAPKVQTFELKEPSSTAGQPVLVFSLSATVTSDRIESVLGSDVAIWTITIAEPNNDFTKSRTQLSEFRALVRWTLNLIKARHGQTTTLHVFPAMSVSTAIEFGRARQPKADMPWTIYDQNNALGGFVKAISLPMENDS